MPQRPTRWVSWLTVGTVLVCGTGRVWAAANLLDNPGFENGVGDAWQDPYGLPAETSSTIVHSGSFAATRSIISIAGQPYYAELSQDIPFNGGDPLTASAFLKTNFSTGDVAVAGVQVTFLDEDDTPIGTVVKAPEIGGQTDWKQVLVSVQAAPANTATVRYSIYVWAALGVSSGTLSVDDADLEAVYTPPQAQNSLTNPGFENGLPNGWQLQYGTPAVASSDVVHSGTVAAKATIASVSAQDYWSQLSQTVTVAAGEPVHAAIWIRTTWSPVASARAGLLVNFVDASGQVIQKKTLQADELGGDSPWTLVEVNTPAAPANTVQAVVTAYLYAPKDDTASLNGFVYFDDALFEKVDHPIAVPDHLRNADFENGTVFWKTIGYPASAVTSPVHGGSYAACATVSTVSQQAFWSQTYQTINVPAKTKITIKTYATSTFVKDAKGKGSLLVEFFDQKGKLLKDKSKTIGGTNGWKPLSIVKTKSPSKTDTMRVSLTLYAPKGNQKSVGGEVCFDDVSVELP